MKNYFLLLFIVMTGGAKNDFQKVSSGDLVASRRLSTSSAGRDVIDHVVVGYQRWFSCPGDGANEPIWWRWIGSVIIGVTC